VSLKKIKPSRKRKDKAIARLDAINEPVESIDGEYSTRE
jgi:hypothetical protein